MQFGGEWDEAIWRAWGKRAGFPDMPDSFMPEMTIVAGENGTEERHALWTTPKGIRVGFAYTITEPQHPESDTVLRATVWYMGHVADRNMEDAAAGDGIGLTTIEHPKGPGMGRGRGRLHKASLETVEIELPDTADGDE